MFLRWQGYTRTRKTGYRYRGMGDAGDVRWRGIIIEAVRIDGKPRQRHVAVLVSFTESEVDADRFIAFQALPSQPQPQADQLNHWHAAQARLQLWAEMLDRLDRIDRLTRDDRKRIEAAVAEKLPRPSKTELAQFRARLRQELHDRASAR
jgi:hypothetical protein